jgi:hypothetical protein
MTGGLPEARSYWPCTLVAHDDHYSITLGNELDLLAHHFGGRDAGGYAVEGLVKRLARKKDPKLVTRVEFDSEASMFCAYGKDLDALHALATLLAEATGTTPPTDEQAVATLALPARPALTAAEDHEARACLLAGFVLDLDPKRQRRFYELVPVAPSGEAHRKLLDELKAEDPAIRISAAERIRRHASTSVWDWGSFVGDPRVVGEIVSALDRERDEAVLAAILTAATNVCARHLPDLHLRASFEVLVKHPSASVRHRAVSAATRLFSWSWDALLPLFDDRDAKVRGAVVSAAMLGEESFQTAISDDHALYPRTEELPARVYARVVRALDDRNAAVRINAAAAIASIDRDGAEQALEQAVAREKVANVRAAMERARDRVVENAPFRPCRRGPVLELTRFRRLAATGLDGPDVERALRARHPELLANVEVSSRAGYFAAWEKEHTARGEPLRALVAALRSLA